MNKSKAIGEHQPRRRWGMPPKVKTEASLTKRMLVTFSERDIKMIDEIMDMTGVASMSQVIRDSIRKHHKLLVEENPVK